MNSVVVMAFFFAVAALAALAVVWWWARRVKEGYDTSPTELAGKTASLQMTPESANRLRELSPEPILLKQSEDGVRVQIEHRPMLPLMAFVGQDVSSAINEAAVLVTEKWGPVWVALVTTREDGAVTAQRIS